MSGVDVQINQDPDSIVIQMPPQAIEIQQVIEMIQVIAPSRPPSFLPYSFIATEDNQTVFTPLPATPLAIITLAITGTLQNELGTIPDFTVSGLTITLSQGVAAGNTVYGIIQVS